MCECLYVNMCECHYGVIRKYVPLLHTHLQHQNDTVNKQTHAERRRKTSLTIFLPLTLFVRFRKGCVGFYSEMELETEHKL